VKKTGRVGDLALQRLQRVKDKQKEGVCIIDRPAGLLAVVVNLNYLLAHRTMHACMFLSRTDGQISRNTAGWELLLIN
jgi:hypothetical protein